MNHRLSLASILMLSLSWPVIGSPAVAVALQPQTPIRVTHRQIGPKARASTDSQAPLDNWQPTNVADAPPGRLRHTLTWTGTEMFVWGGETIGSQALRSGGLYNPATDSWRPVSIDNAPAARTQHTAVWDGSRVIVWGGCGSGCNPFYNTGGRYDLASGTWSPTSMTDAPEARADHTAVWVNGVMVVWGGYKTGYLPLGDGGRYDPVNNRWTTVSTDHAPTARTYHTAVRAGNQMIVWGGTNSGVDTNTGAVYNVQRDAWRPTPLSGAPEPRYVHAAGMVGAYMVVWGGCQSSCTIYLNTGGALNLQTGQWQDTSLLNAPVGRCCMAYDNNRRVLFVWGGQGNTPGPIGTGAMYDPGQNRWIPTTDQNAPSGREWTRAVWSGSQFIVWGGNGECDPACNELNTGGRYTPGR